MNHVSKAKIAHALSPPRTVKKLNPLEIQQRLVVIGRSLDKPVSAHPGER
jgi:hypothetical protein